ncbi:MAG TPA: ATP-dependent DNA ligase [Euzebya sp.]|nr:ATP-dependent DNA ligase [Euzebya sp.]
MSTWPFQPPLAPMEAKVRTDLPPEGQWAYEPKWDGFRCLSWGAADPADIRFDSRQQRPLTRYFPELLPALEAVPAGAVLDGEVIVSVDGALDFDALQQRIHPADSRVQMLSRATPAQLVAFDILALEGQDLRARPFRERRELLVQVMAPLAEVDAWHLTPSTTDRDTALRWFSEFESAGCDGIVCKNLDGVYVSGKREMVKVKHRRDADVVIGGYREHKDGGKIGSLLLGLFNDAGDLHFIGHCSGFGNADRVTLLERLQGHLAEQSFGDPDGGEGTVRAPGGVSRWTGDKDLSWVPIRPDLVCTISYDQLTGGRFRHATRFERWRPDKDPHECTMDQLERPEGPDLDEILS